MVSSSILHFLALSAVITSTLAHPGHSDLLSKRELMEKFKRQDDLLACRSTLAKRHEPRMKRLESRRSEIQRRNWDGWFKPHGPKGHHNMSQAHSVRSNTHTRSKSGSRSASSSAISASVSSGASLIASPSGSGVPSGSPPSGGSFSGGSMPTGGMGGGMGGGQSNGTTGSATATAVSTRATVFPTKTSDAEPASQTTQAIDSACALSPAQEEGPYYIPGELIRNDLTEDQEGLPFYAEITLIDTNTCNPLVGAAIEVWSCNATGEYAGFISTDTSTTDAGLYNGEIIAVGGKNDAGSTITDAKTFLRGQQLTDSSGNVQFTTLIPGWYSGRAAHIHFRVHVGGETTDNGTYVGGNLTHTGQSFFGEDLYSQVVNIYPYNLDTNVRTTNAEDRPWTEQSGVEAAWNLYYVDDSDITQGFIGYLNLAVDSTATGQTGI